MSSVTSPHYNQWICELLYSDKNIRVKSSLQESLSDQIAASMTLCPHFILSLRIPSIALMSKEQTFSHSLPDSCTAHPTNADRLRKWHTPTDNRSLFFRLLSSRHTSHVVPYQALQWVCCFLQLSDMINHCWHSSGRVYIFPFVLFFVLI